MPHDIGDNTNSPRPKRTSARRLHGALVRHLGKLILSGHYQPGERFPGQEDMARALFVSRGAYREAVQVLAAKGLLTSVPKTGTRISARFKWNWLDEDVAAWLSPDDVHPSVRSDLREVRMIVEPDAARIAADRRQDADIAILEQALNDLQTAALGSDLARAANRAFHVAILAATHNEALVKLAPILAAAIDAAASPEHLQNELPAYCGRVFAAIRSGKGKEAGRAMTELLERDSGATDVHPKASRSDKLVHYPYK